MATHNQFWKRLHELPPSPVAPRFALQPESVKPEERVMLGHGPATEAAAGEKLTPVCFHSVTLCGKYGAMIYWQDTQDTLAGAKEQLGSRENGACRD